MTDSSTSPASNATACPSEAPDASLLQAWAAHQRSTDFTELVHRHIGLVRGIASRQLGEDHADDTTQTVFAILARKASSLTGVRSLGAWLHRVTMLQCRNAVRRLIRERRSQQAAMENAILSAARDPLADALPHLDSAIDALRECDRELILMRYSEGLTFAQAAGRTGRSEAALRQQAGRALETLSTHLRRRGIAVPSAALAPGLGQVLCGAGSAEAALLCGRAALAAAQKLTSGTLAGITFSTMSTIQSILAGSAAALLLTAGPVLWRAQQIGGAEKDAAAGVQRAPGTNTARATASTAEKPEKPKVPVTPATAAAAPPAEPSTDLFAELEDVMEAEITASLDEWARRSAWLEARRLGRMLGLSEEKEAELREFVEEQLVARADATFGDGNENGGGTGGADAVEEGDDPDKHKERREYKAKLEEWYANHLTPEQNTARQHAEQNRNEALVERLAEDALHDISSSIPLTEEQKKKLYDTAAAKAAKQLADDDYGGSAQFGADISVPSAPPLEITAADTIAAVLDPAQLELWEQSREQDRLIADVIPRRLADVAVNTIRQRGLSGALMSLIKQALESE